MLFRHRSEHERAGEGKLPKEKLWTNTTLKCVVGSENEKEKKARLIFFLILGYKWLFKKVEDRAPGKTSKKFVSVP